MEPIHLLVIALLLLVVILLILNVLSQGRNARKIRRLNEKIVESDMNLAKACSHIDSITDKLKMLGKLYMASDLLMRQDNEEKVYKEINSQIIEIMHPKMSMFYALDYETRKFHLVSWYPLESKYPKEVDFMSNTIMEEQTPDSFSRILKNNEGKPLGYLKVIGKHITLSKIQKPVDLCQTDYDILTIYTNQVSVVLDKIRAYKIIQRMATTDNLTKLLNRHSAKIRLNQEVKRAARTNSCLSVLSLDVDFFKKVNDNCGHDVGDLALQYLAQIMQKCAREYDIPARWGGEEFLIFLPNTDENGAYILAERIRQAVETGDFPHCKLTISVGIATFPTDARSIDNVMKLADEATYYSKQNGRNRTTIYSNIKDLIKRE